jgi:hypothetical protein
MTIPLSAQATAVELAAVNLRGHCETLAQRVRKGKRPQSDLDMAGKRFEDFPLATAIEARA